MDCRKTKPYFWDNTVSIVPSRPPENNENCLSTVASSAGHANQPTPGNFNRGTSVYNCLLMTAPFNEKAFSVKFL